MRNNLLLFYEMNEALINAMNAHLRYMNIMYSNLNNPENDINPRRQNASQLRQTTQPQLSRTPTTLSNNNPIQHINNLNETQNNTGNSINNTGNLTEELVFTASLPPIMLDLTNIFNQATQAGAVVTPTAEQINNSCIVVPFSEIPEENRNVHICPIDRQPLEETDRVMQIRHCGHYFRENNLRHNFTLSSLCPICRHNITTLTEE